MRPLIRKGTLDTTRGKSVIKHIPSIHRWRLLLQEHDLPWYAIRQIWSKYLSLFATMAHFTLFILRNSTNLLWLFDSNTNFCLRLSCARWLKVKTCTWLVISTFRIDAYKLVRLIRTLLIGSWYFVAIVCKQNYLNLTTWTRTYNVVYGWST